MKSFLVPMTCAAVITLAPALTYAGPQRSSKVQTDTVIVVSPQHLALGTPTDSCRAVNTFDLFDGEGLSGTQIGTGVACITQEKPECGEPPLLPPFTPGCVQRVRLELTLNFCPGPLCQTGNESLTFRTVFREIFTGPFSLVNIAKGRVSEGTGAFEGAHGTLEGAGSTILTLSGINTTIVWVIRLGDNGNADFDGF